MSKAKYPNRDALNQALDQYLDAMFQFVSERLDEQSIRDILRLQSSDDLRKEMEVKDIAHLIRERWSWSFKEKFKIIDRNDIRYYDARSVTSLIIEGRNQVSHQRLRELDPEFTRSQLFLIAEILGKIKSPDAQREVEDIRDELFEDTTERLVTMAVEAEKAKYEKPIAEVEKRLAAEKESNKKLSNRIINNAVKLDEKKEDLEKLSGQLVSVKLDKKESEKQFNSTSKQLEKLQAVHSACEECIAKMSNQLASTETERDGYKERFDTASKELEKAETKWLACEDSLAAVRKLFTIAPIGNQEVQATFFPFEIDSTTWILDRRGVDKKKYLLELLEQKQPTIIYVQSEERIDQLLTLVGPEKADLIGKYDERTSETEEMEILEKLENGELIAVVSDTAFSTLAPSHRIEHFVFCHLVPGLDEFFKQCEPAFTSEKNAYLHLIYNREQDVEGLNQWLTQKYPEREALQNLYMELEKLVGVNGDFSKFENLYGKLDIASLKITKLGFETGLAIFEELNLLERNDEGIRLLPSSGKKLEEASEIYRRGEKLKKETKDFRDFQLECSVEKIWEEILEKLDVDSEQILREVNTDEMYLSVSEIESDQQPAETVENDSEPDDGDTEASQTPKSARANAKVTEEQVKEIRVRSAAGESNSELAKEFNKKREKKPSVLERYKTETTVETRDEIAVKVAELRINIMGSKLLSWHRIREKLGLKNDQFHKVIRLSEGYRNAVIGRIKSLKSAEGGWEYNGKLSVLTGIEDIENYLE